MLISALICKIQRNPTKLVRKLKKTYVMQAGILVDIFLPAPEVSVYPYVNMVI